MWLRRAVNTSRTNEADDNQILGMLRNDQELVLMEDLMFALYGMEGRFVKVRGVSENPTVVEFWCSEKADVSLQELVKRILPLCGAHYRLQQFVEARLDSSQGLISNALAASIRAILLEYALSVTQMDDELRLGQLSLSVMWFHCQPLWRSFRVLLSVVEEADEKNLTGVALLNLVHTESVRRGGDVSSREMLERLWRECCVPFNALLKGWIYEGVIDDPFGEFLVTDKSPAKSTEKSATLWENRYTVNRSAVPDFLEHAVDKILTAGKCLNAVRDCGKRIPAQLARLAGKPLPANKELLLDAINFAHGVASNELLAILRNDFKLMERLRSVKHFFLLDQGDFMRDFLDAAGAELDKWRAHVSLDRLAVSGARSHFQSPPSSSRPFSWKLPKCLSRLSSHPSVFSVFSPTPTFFQPLLELSIRSSACAGDAFHDDVSCQLVGPTDTPPQSKKI